MDIIKDFYGCLDAPQRRRLEALIFEGVRAALSGWHEAIEASQAAFAELRAKADELDPEDFKQQEDHHLQELQGYEEEREDLLRLLAALVSSASDPHDPVIDCTTIEQIIGRRRQFYTTPVTEQSAQSVSGGAGDPSRRRGRKPRYSWPDFAAEMVRRSHAEPIRNQAALEEHMAQWCAKNWDCEPAPSLIREWVGPTFAAIGASMGERRLANGADNSSPEFPANPPLIAG